MLLLCSLFSIQFIFAQSGNRQTRVNEYINRYKHMAITEMKRTGIPASITLAQGILESDFGNSFLVKKANNHFGIKCHRDWSGKRVYVRDDRPKDCFRKYGSDYDSFEDHSEFLTRNGRYGKLFRYSITDYEKWAKGLKTAGYATNPYYAQRLIHIIETYDLDEYDYYVSEDPQCYEATTATPTYHKGMKAVIFNCDVTVPQAAKSYNIKPEALMRYNRLHPDAIIPAYTLVYLQQSDGAVPQKVQNPNLVSNEVVPDVAAIYGISANAFQAYELKTAPARGQETASIKNAIEPKSYASVSRSRPLPPLRSISASKPKQSAPPKVKPAPKIKSPIKAKAKVELAPAPTSGRRYAAPAPLVKTKQACAQRQARQYHSLKHIVKKGETLFSISRKYGTSVQAIQQVNNMGRSTTIMAGAGIRIPTSVK